MKKYIIPAGLVIMLMASCTVEESLEVSIDENGGSRITFTGESYASTKVSIGEKDGSTYPLLWFTGDVIGISYKDTTATGAFKGEIAELYSESSGSASGVFQTVNTLSTEAAADLVIVYPGSTLTYGDGVVSGTVERLQTQRTAGSSIHVGNSAVAYAETSISAGQTEGVAFTLNQTTAFVKLILSTSEYSSYNLTGAILYGEGATLSGDVAYDINTQTMTVTNGSESVGATISRPSTFSGTQEIYFTAIPCDLTSLDTYVIVTMENPDGNETVTIPVQVTGGKLEASCLSVITVSSISKSSCTWDWYDPVETRDLVDGWAYGPQNTYFIEQLESGDGDTHLNIDVKARGDFSKVKEPKYYGLITSSSEMSSRKLIHFSDGVEAYEVSPTRTVNADYTIDVYCYDQPKNGRWAVVGIYDEDYNILWSYMIWRYQTADPPQSVTYTSDIALLDRNLGAAYSNSLAEDKGTFDAVFAYFQWGRKDPFMWSNSGLSNYTEVTTPVGSDVGTAIANPSVIYAYGGSAEDHGNWYELNQSAELWGMENNTTDWYDPSGVGHKTIYDPCPAGYRVCDPRVFNEVKTNAERWEVNISNSYQDESVIKTDSPFTSGTTSVLAYKLSDDTYDYWPYSGCHWAGSGANWGNRTSSNNRHAALYWSNGVDPTNTYRGVCMQYCYFSASYDDETVTANKARAFAVRCQVDDENR